ncbi:MAG: hypothetical protein KKF16_03925 [Euryarchaeota archaeon]|nr:hypothetical protein [Euryarchaeota archaeon]MBV1730446.1 hypothetical protein [Methanobacterium sp.]MBU4548001.1 hypothetical protein [Euryarchaeota archaeon]MBU4607156.1 hypothetical protein [Euryarchaeota archaeon]MBV1754111.1 hypothetical protein [Methanobacterium sp.]
MKKKEKKEDSDNDQIIRELEEKVQYQSQALNRINEKLSQCLDRLGEIRQEKQVLEEKISALEIQKMDFQLLQHDQLQNDYDKMSHRAQITKKELDDARNRILFLEKVLQDMENRSLLDYIKGKYPESWGEYKNRE